MYISFYLSDSCRDNTESETFSGCHDFRKFSQNDSSLCSCRFVSPVRAIQTRFCCRNCNVHIFFSRICYLTAYRRSHVKNYFGKLQPAIIVQYIKQRAKLQLQLDIVINREISKHLMRHIWGIFIKISQACGINLCDHSSCCRIESSKFSAPKNVQRNTFVI